MRTRALKDRSWALLILLSCNGVHAQLSNDHVRYELVDSKGVSFRDVDANEDKGMYIRRTRPDGSFTSFKLPGFDGMNKKYNFDFELLDDSLISAPQGDYFVVESMRSIASNPQEDEDYVKHPLWWKHRCGHGVHLTYLVRVFGKNARIVEEYLTECTGEARVWSAAGETGYEVKGYAHDAGKSVLYILQKNGRFMRTKNGPYRDVP